MDRQKKERPRAELERFMRALEDYHKTGECSVTCNHCNKPITFKKLGETGLSSDCGCGKYKDTLRGL
jgi:hypothetical protein